MPKDLGEILVVERHHAVPADSDVDSADTGTETLREHLGQRVVIRDVESALAPLGKREHLPAVADDDVEALGIVLGEEIVPLGDVPGDDIVFDRTTEHLVGRIVVRTVGLRHLEVRTDLAKLFEVGVGRLKAPEQFVEVVSRRFDAVAQMLLQRFGDATLGLLLEHEELPLRGVERHDDKLTLTVSDLALGFEIGELLRGDLGQTSHDCGIHDWVFRF